MSKIIVLTAGHSNTDPGAVNGSDREADIAQDIRKYARKGIKLPLNNCLPVLAGDEEFDTYTCPIEVK